MAWRIAETQVGDIKQSTDMVGLISEYVVLKKSGHNFVGLCPFHTEKTPSFSVDPAKQLFYCFGCGAGGDAIGFIMRLEGLSFPEALERLAGRVGIQLEQAELSPEVERARARQQRLLLLMQVVSQFYHQLLLKHQLGQPGRQYLKSRGIDAVVSERFSLGYAPPNSQLLQQHLIQQGYSLEELQQAGVIAAGKQGEFIDRFRNRVIYPIDDERGRVCGFGGRIVGQGEPKYLNSAENDIFHKGQLVYGLHRAVQEIRRLDQALVVEGYMDVITAHHYGLTNTVASLGTALTADQVKLIMRYTRRIVLCYDADAAGTRAALRGLQILKQAGAQAEVLELPEGQDPDSILRQQGLQALQQKLEQETLSPVEYRLSVSLKSRGSSSVARRVAAVQEVLPELAAVTSEVELEALIQAVARQSQLPEAAIKAELTRITGLQSAEQIKKDKKVNPRHNRNITSLLVKPGYQQAEQGLLQWIVRDKTRWQMLVSEFGEEPFHEQVMNRVCRKVIPLLNRGIALEDISSYLEEQVLQECWTGVIQDNAAPQWSWENCMAMLRWERLRQELLQMQEQIQEAELTGDNELVHQLLRSKQALQIQIQQSGIQRRMPGNKGLDITGRG